MEGDSEVVGFGDGEGWGEEGDVAFQGVAAEVDADDAAGLVLDGEVHDVHCLSEGITAVDGEDEVGVHLVLTVGFDGIQHSLDIHFLRQTRGGFFTGRGAKFKISDTIGFEGLEHLPSGEGDGVYIVDEVVDVGVEEGKEGEDVVVGCFGAACCEGVF